MYSRRDFGRIALAASKPKYCVCNAPKSQANLSPMSFLHAQSDPFIYVIVGPTCKEGECEIEARQQVRAMTAEMHVKVDGL